jgi:hypothetical protein
MTDNKNFALFNSFAVDATIFNIKALKGPYGDFIAITLITHLMNDDEGCTVEFIDRGNLMSLYQKGFLPTGRRITCTGHIKSVAQTYTNEQGEVVMLKRPKITLVDAAIPTGGLGALPADKAANTVRRTGVVVKPAQAATQGLPQVEPAVDGTPVF